MRACLSIWLERFRGRQREDERWGLFFKFLDVGSHKFYNTSTKYKKHEKIKKTYSITKLIVNFYFSDLTRKEHEFDCVNRYTAYICRYGCRDMHENQHWCTQFFQFGFSSQQGTQQQVFLSSFNFWHLGFLTSHFSFAFCPLELNVTWVSYCSWNTDYVLYYKCILKIIFVLQIVTIRARTLNKIL